MLRLDASRVIAFDEVRSEAGCRQCDASGQTSAWAGLLASCSEQGRQKVSLGTEECTFGSCHVHTVGSGSVLLVVSINSLGLASSSQL